MERHLSMLWQQVISTKLSRVLVSWQLKLKRKPHKYSSVDGSTYIFQPHAIETLGAFGGSVILSI